MKAISKTRKRTSAAEVRKFFLELIDQLPTQGTFVSSKQVDDTMYRQQFVINGMVFNVTISDMGGMQS
jgi:hypothetical protein